MLFVPLCGSCLIELRPNDARHNRTEARRRRSEPANQRCECILAAMRMQNNLLRLSMNSLPECTKNRRYELALLDCFRRELRFRLDLPLHSGKHFDITQMKARKLRTL